MKLDENKFWFSIADSDILTWAQAIAGEKGLDVEIIEPEDYPLDIQGPKSEEVVA